MGFHLVYGNDADALLDALAERLRAPHPAAAPLAPEIVLVPQFGLRRWLEIRLAQKLGIVANVEFAAPAEYAWRLLRAANPGLASTSGYELEILRWRIFALLAPLALEPGFDALAAALGDGDQSTRLRFADALAHAYERDLAYRSDRLAAWERGAEAGDWRAELWRRLVHSSSQPHRAALLAAWQQKYGDGVVAPPGLPPRLSAFACANISPDLLRFYGAVARHAEVDFYLPNPCREYWGDVRSARQRLRDGDTFDSDAFADAENPALAAWGRAGRDLVERLFTYELVQPDAEHDRSREPRGATLLARVQRDVLDRLPPTNDKVDDDGSIQFHRCHSRLREVQALHDRLLDLFARDPTLTPRDVAVMSPEIGAYAPYIESVFGGIEHDNARYLPFALSDCPLRQAHPLVGVALRLIALPTSRLQLAEIGEWLALPALQRRFGLDADEVTRLVGWLREAGVRWGLDAAQHAATGAGDYVEFSWRFGLERLLLGYASGGEAGVIEGIAPAAAVEGTNANVLGAMLRIVDVLATLLRAQRQSHAPQQWQKLYNNAFAQLFDADDDRDATRALERVRTALADFADETAQAGMDDEIDWRCVRDELSARLAEPERAFRFFGGGVTVCGMVPLRAVPFRVICLIGMNENAFPRRDRASPFERTDERRLEPSIRDEDRYLFLQQLMAARDEFHLSWVGENARDGSREEPSAVVAELLAILAQYGVDEKNLVVEHPLQPFSPRLFDGSDARLFTYDGAWFGATVKPPVVASRFMDAPAAAASTEQIRIDWREWQRFWRNPAAAYFRNTLGIELAHAPEADDGADDIVLSRLGEYRVFDALFDAQQDSDPTTQCEWLRASAALPAGTAGDQAFADLRAPVSVLASKRDELIGTRAPALPAPFELDLGVLVLSGLLPAHRDGLLLRALPGEANGHRLLQSWLDFLLLATQRDDAHLVLLEWKDDAPSVREARAVEPAQARNWLSDLALLHVQGVAAPLPLFPRSAYAYARRRAKRGRADADETAWTLAAFRAAQTAFITDERHRGEDADLAFALATRDIFPFDPATHEGRAFADCAQRVFAPLLATLRPLAADSAAAKTKASKPRAKSGKAK